ncbi:MAG: hypothetical protein R3324_18860, partial [Halobacteriales archaeon]|nr:hypothetical protein [Halobacteriales archaeon]
MVDSSRFQVDLSASRVVRDEEYYDLLYGELYGLYHEAVSRYIDGVTELKPQQVRAYLIPLGGWILEARRRGVTPDAGSRALYERLRGLPCFPRADADGGLASLAALVCNHPEDGQRIIPYVYDAYPGVEASVLGPVALAGKDSLSRLTLLAAVENATTRVVTMELVRQRVRQQNRTRFVVASGRPLPEFSNYEDVRLDERVARIVPIDPRSDEHNRTGTTQLRVEGRTIRVVRGSTPLFIVLDGDFQPAKDYDDIERDAKFFELARNIVERLPVLMTAVIQRYSTCEGPPPAPARSLLWWWVSERARGEVPRSLGRQLGMTGLEVRDFARAVKLARGESSSDRARELFDLLGEVP